jgi:hypothetical protein
MKKSILQPVVLTLLLVGFMCIPGKEGSVSFAVENLWTTFKDPDIDWPQLQHFRFRSRSAPIPNFGKDHFTGERWHFGFPCWAFYVDVGTVKNLDTKHSLEPKVWYAKLDLYRTLINGLVGLMAGFSLIGFYHFIRSKGLKKPPISLRTRDFGLNDE